ncbi:MAG: AAA family ATPase [Deltaproteobacteria bacterium]|nr:AAA family ATPase [Deltaproteobacteria bacterium]
MGTGKTTLCRQLLRRLDDDETIEKHLLLDPYFSKPIEFLRTISEMLGSTQLKDEPERTEWQLREAIKHHLFEHGVQEQKLVVLIIDEGQKIPEFCLEMLREFLNYETNEAKLLQIVIFAQREFDQILEKNPGVADRVSFSYYLGPLNFRDTRSMIEFRLQNAAEQGKLSPQLSYWAYRKIFRTTGGYPRRIVSLCHQIILALIIQNKFRADWFLVRSCVMRNLPELDERRSFDRAAVLAGLVVILFVLVVFPERVGIVTPGGSTAFLSVPAIVLNPTSGPAIPVEEKPHSLPFRDKGPDVEKVKLATTAETIPELTQERTDLITTAEPVKVIDEEQTLTPSGINTGVGHPAILGLARVEQKGVVWRMIEDVYGVCDRRHLDRIAESNPHIKNLDIVFAGDIIMFPSIPAEFQPSFFGNDGYWVEIDNEKSLERAYRKLKETRSIAGNILQLCPYWNNTEGLRFSVILRKRFIGENSAREALHALPELFAGNARIIKHWKEGTVFFARLVNVDEISRDIVPLQASGEPEKRETQ